MNYSNGNDDLNAYEENSDLYQMGMEEGEDGAWEESMDTIVDAQKTQVLNFLTKLSTDELHKMDAFVKKSQSEGLTIGIREMETALTGFRTSASSTQESASLKSQLQSASSIKEKEALLAGEGLYNNPKSHYFDGTKSLPRNTLTQMDKSRNVLRDMEVYVAPNRSPKPEMGRGVAQIPVPQTVIANDRSLRFNRKIDTL